MGILAGTARSEATRRARRLGAPSSMRWRAFAFARAWTAAPARAARVTIGPYLQDVRPDSFVVAFETDVETHAAVEVGAARVATHGTRHEARVTGLHPGVRYKYHLVLDDVESGGGEALTAPPPDGDKPFSFLVYGDTRGGDDEAQIVALMRGESADLVLNTGDMVRTGDDEAAWRHFFEMESSLMSSMPLYPAAGNHELYKDPNADHFRRFFVLPDDGRARRYYHFRWGRAVEFVALDGNGNFDEQARWLENLIRKAEADGVRHLFVWMHQPPFSTGGHCGAAIAEQDWVDLFEHHPIVRAVFGGHDHCYERLERNGVRYFVSGGAGAHVYPEATACPSYDYAARKFYVATHHYVRVQVSGEDVEVTALPLAGAPLDQVRLSSRELRVASADAPPLVDDRLFGSLPRNYMIYGSGFGLLLILGGFLRRRRR